MFREFPPVSVQTALCVPEPLATAFQPSVNVREKATSLLMSDVYPEVIADVSVVPPIVQPPKTTSFVDTEPEVVAVTDVVVLAPAVPDVSSQVDDCRNGVTLKMWISAPEFVPTVTVPLVGMEVTMAPLQKLIPVELCAAFTSMV